MKKYLYTDIDGVLCLGSEIKPKNTKWGWVYSFNKKAVKIYNEILKITDAEIIVSSDWKDEYNLKQLGEIFEWQGIIKKPIGITPSLANKTMQFLERDRCREILIHVNINKPDIWVAIDDLDLQDWWSGKLVVHDYKEKNKDPHFVFMPKFNEGVKQTGKFTEICDKLKMK